MSPPGILDHGAYQDLVRRLGPPTLRWQGLAEVADESLGFAVHLATFRGRLVLVRHRERQEWELPGGRRESGESILWTACRELEEECGSRRARVLPLCAYSVVLGGRVSHGLLCLSQLEELPGPPATSEIAEARALDTLPEALCYPHIQGRILEAWVTGCLALPWKGLPPSLPARLLSILADSPPPEGQIPAISQNMPVPFRV